jgi:cytochrome b
MKTFLKNVWRSVARGWMAFAHVLGRVNSAILLTVVYVLMILPMRLLWGIFHKDPLRLRARTKQDGGWLGRDREPATSDERRHPF